MHKAGAFRKGTTFIVHKYEERVPLVPRPQVNLPKPAEPATQTRVSRLVPEKTFLDFVVVDSEGSLLGAPLQAGDARRIGGSRESWLEPHIEVGTSTRVPPRLRCCLKRWWRPRGRSAGGAGAGRRSKAPVQEEEPVQEEPVEAAPVEEPEEAVVITNLPLLLDTIDLKLVDAAGEPVAKQKVKIELADGSVRDAVTDSDGAILVANVPGGQFVVSIAD